MSSPIRTCIGCGAKREKSALLRLTARDGHPHVDGGRAAQARGAYLCDASCAQRAVAKRAFGRAFRGAVAAGEGLVDEVRTRSR